MPEVPYVRAASLHVCEQESVARGLVERDGAGGAPSTENLSSAFSARLGTARGYKTGRGYLPRRIGAFATEDGRQRKSDVLPFTHRTEAPIIAYPPALPAARRNASEEILTEEKLKMTFYAQSESPITPSEGAAAPLLVI